MKERIKDMIQESIDVKKNISIGDLENIIQIITECFSSGKKVLVCGNGGSAADAQHMVAEFVCRFKKERKGLPCIALTTNTSILTAWSNDYDSETVFEREVEALGKQNDVLLGISTSGDSSNVIKAIEKAKTNGMKTIGLLGKDGGKTKGTADAEIIVDSNDTARIQESHITIIHIICELVEEELFGK